MFNLSFHLYKFQIILKGEQVQVQGGHHAGRDRQGRGRAQHVDRLPTAGNLRWRTVSNGCSVLDSRRCVCVVGNNGHTNIADDGARLIGQDEDRQL